MLGLWGCANYGSGKRDENAALRNVEADAGIVFLQTLSLLKWKISRHI
jgi:hypothetical protein